MSIDDNVRCLFGVECVEASPTDILVRRQINARESEVQRLDGGLSASRPMAHGFQRDVWSHHTRRTRSIESHWLAPIAPSISHRPSNVNRSKRISCFLHGIPVSMRRAQATVTLLNEPILLLIQHCHSFYVRFQDFLMICFSSEPRAYCPPCFVSSLSCTLRNFLLDMDWDGFYRIHSLVITMYFKTSSIILSQ